MRQPLCATLDAAGLPCAPVPFPCMWELVEYLSYQRVVVRYEYHASHFTVTLPHMDLASVQLLLDEWVHAEPSELQPACGDGVRGSIPTHDHASTPSAFRIGGHVPPERS
jgi:hypothetical protein